MIYRGIYKNIDVSLKVRVLSNVKKDIVEKEIEFLK